MSAMIKGKNVCVFLEGLSIVSGQSYSSFVLSIASLVVVSLVPRPHLCWSGYETNLLT